MLILSAAAVMAAFASLFPLTNRILPFFGARSFTNSRAVFRELLVFSKSKISIFFFTPKINGFVDGCLRDFTKPKCAPAVKRASTRAVLVLFVSFIPLEIGNPLRIQGISVTYCLYNNQF